MTEDQWPVRRERNEEQVVSGGLSAGKLKRLGEEGGEHGVVSRKRAPGINQSGACFHSFSPNSSQGTEDCRQAFIKQKSTGIDRYGTLACSQSQWSDSRLDEKAFPRAKFMKSPSHAPSPHLPLSPSLPFT